MDENIKNRVRVFDRDQPFSVIYRRLPHWSQAGTLCFITWRTWDSIPEQVLQTWIADRDAWLRDQGIDPTSVDWQTKLARLDPKVVREFKLKISDRWNDHLDSCHGSCVLRNPELSQIVDASLRHFDGQRYDLTDWVIMPNHVHLLAAFPDEEEMLLRCESWKHFTATRINRALRRKGRFWQSDGFDHLIRSVEQFEYLRGYIAENPVSARLRPGEFIHVSKD
jgi:putative transposase